jgi:cation-transporting ATPase 13A1
MVQLQHPKEGGIERATLHAIAPSRRAILTAVFVVIYAYTASEMYATMGIPRQEAIVQQEALRIKALQELAEEQTEGGGLGAAAAEAEEEAEEPEDTGEVVWQTAELVDHEDDDSLVEDEDERPLPSDYLPSAFSCCVLFMACTLHSLFYLGCHWSVDFSAKALFTDSETAEEGAYVQVQPKEHRGKAAMVRLVRSARTGRLTFEFQRQKFEYYEAHELRRLKQKGGEIEELEGGDAENGAIRLIACPVGEQLGFYIDSKGLKKQEDVDSRKDHFGDNRLAIKQPTFVQLLVDQLLSPIAVFQIFCSVLWLLDAYWQYTVFTVFSIVMLESTSAFQRLKTLQQLTGMSSKPYMVKVYRMGKWHDMTTEELLPGDLVSLKGNRVSKAITKPGAPGTPAAPGARPPMPMPGSDIVPCDCLVLSGSAVVNESSLTGESVPLMKDAVQPDTKDKEGTERKLAFDGRDRLHTLFSGTQIVSAGTSGAHCGGDVPKTPDGGCLCYVLRTGFSSSQGELVQLIEFSTQKVSADSKEIFMALFLLLIFALVAAGYVMKTGLEKGDRTTHELLLKCVIIITSVVPRQLPVQMAMAVNQALMALTKAGIFCTEPYRVPFAGKITHCLFDKTGTITTDTLVPVGVINGGEGLIAGARVTLDGIKSQPALNGKNAVLIGLSEGDSGRYSVRVDDRRVSLKPDNINPTGNPPERVPVPDAAADVAMVLSSCQALMRVEGNAELIGDPIEIAGLRGVGWRFDASDSTSRPGRWEDTEKATALLKIKLDKLEPGKAQRAECELEMEQLQKSIAEQKKRAEDSSLRAIKILHRYHFASALQRMSTVCDVTASEGSKSGKVCLVKGSPEAVQKLLASGCEPSWYQETYRTLAERGFRVLALAYKWTPDLDVTTAPDRNTVESGLSFAGFVAFECKTRSDSPTVITALEQAALQTGMLTGDAPLTALHVARKVGMCSKDKPALELTPSSESKEFGVCWAFAVGGSKETVPFEIATVETLREKYELMTTEAVLVDAALKSGDEESPIWSIVQYITVFARMSPQGKARIIRSMQQLHGHQVLMCGDGGNDVGALKQADVGIALLGGFGNSMIGEQGEETEEGEAREASAGDTDDKKAEEDLNKSQEELQRKGRESAALRAKLLKDKQAELTGLQQQWMAEELEAMEKRDGVPPGVMGNMTAVKNITMRLKNEMAAYQRELNAKYGNVYDKPTDMMDMEAGTGMNIIRPGDASVAAPFTSRIPSLRSCIDLLRQGRCTLLSALQQQQIMMLECMISAYTLAALSLEGARSSERQMMASSWLIMTASLAFSYATPIKSMSPVRPLKSLFHPGIFISILGQAAIHLFCLVYAVNMAKENMGDKHRMNGQCRDSGGMLLGATTEELCEEASGTWSDNGPCLQEVITFFKKVKAGEEVDPNDEDPLAEIMALWSTPFLPNLMNSTVFLVETAQVRPRTHTATYFIC